MAINLNNNILNASYLFNTNNQTQKQDSIAQLWNAYGSYQSNAQNSLAGVTEINANLKAVLASYEDAKAEFNTRFDETMGDLSESAKAVKGYNFSVDKENAISTVTNTDEDGKVTTTTKYSKDLQAALDTVKNFVDDYNSAVKFFGDYADVSKRVERMGTTFGDTTYRVSAYESIGLNVNSDGSFAIDEEKLANAIVNDPDKVSRILGEDGLVGKTEDHVSFANGQKDHLFPTAKAMLGDQLDQAALYTGKNFVNMNAANNVGNLLNMMF